MKGTVAFGNAVHKLFPTIESQLRRDPPVRTGYLRLIQEVCDFIRLMQKKSPNVDNAN